LLKKREKQAPSDYQTKEIYPDAREEGKIA
jgi:hypothetical protein